MIKPGVLLNGDYRNVLPFDQDKIREFVTSSWYRYTEGRDAGLAPYDGETNADYNGPRPPLQVAFRPPAVHLGESPAL